MILSVSTPRLPQEIIDFIIDILSDDFRTRKEVLRACSLASRAFVSRCRKHLFRSIVLRSRSKLEIKFHHKDGSLNVERLYDVLKHNPTLAGLVRNVRLDSSRADREWTGCLPTVIQQLSSVESVSLNFDWPPLDWNTFFAGKQNLRGPVLQLCNSASLTSLSLRYVTNLPLAIFSGCCNLKSLSMTDIQLDSSDAVVNHQLRLSYFTYAGCTPAVLRLMQPCVETSYSFLDFSGLHYFAFFPQSSDEVNAGWEVMNRAAQSIHILSFGGRCQSRITLPGPITLAQFHYLRKLDLTLAFAEDDEEPEPLEGVYDLLESVPEDNCLETIDLDMWIGFGDDQEPSDDPSSLALLSWELLDSVLLEPKFVHLRNVTVSIILFTSSPEDISDPEDERRAPNFYRDMRTTIESMLQELMPGAMGENLHFKFNLKLSVGPD